MSHDHNKSSKHTAANAWLEIQLEEELGEVRPPDLRHRVLASDAERRAHAAHQVSAPSSTSRWLAAAVLLIGIATVFAVLQFSDQTPDKNELDTAPQGAQGEILAKSLAEFQQHAAMTTNISICASVLVSPDRLVLSEHIRTDVPVAARMLIRTELRTLKKIRPAGWLWLHTIRLELPDNRYVTCAVHRTTEHRLGIRGLGDFEMTERLRASLAPILDAVRIKTRLEAGIVHSREDLLRDGDVAIPKDIETLNCSNLTDDDLQLLARFPDIRDLNLSRSGKTINGLGLQHLLQLPRLKKLNLSNIAVDDKHVAALGPHPTLGELDLSDSDHVRGTCFTAFANSPSLHKVHLQNTAALSDEGLAALATVPKLNYLNLSRSSRGNLTTAGLRRLGTMKRLQSLVLSKLPGEIDDVVAALGAAPMLRDLDLVDTQVTNAGLAAMVARRAAMPDKSALPLHNLNLSLCKQLQPGMVRHIGEFLNLRTLNMTRSSLATIDKNGKATLDDCQDLQRLHKLEILELNGVRLDANACKHIARLPSLTRLDISFTGAGIDDAALHHLSEATKLKNLLLSGCDNFTDAGLIPLRQLTTLQLLDLNRCDGFSISGLDSFRSMRPDCELRLPDRFR